MDWTVLQNPFVRGAVSGLLAAAAVDFAAFKSWQTWEDIMTYNWRVATWRWFQGMVIGLAAAAGLEGLA